jgi:hypothetical protein
MHQPSKINQSEAIDLNIRWGIIFDFFLEKH